MNKKSLTIYITLVFYLSLACGLQSFGQCKKERLSSPMDVPLVMSSSFCEPRPGHFHTGVDYKTQGRCGVNLLSIKAGELYRMKISPYGYGRVLYVRHYDSTLSVYAHMQSFREDIQEFAVNLQYECESFFIDTIFEEAPFKFECGKKIGYSGNTGHSFGPHLHFEIRKYPTEEALNAQDFYPVKDTIAPDFFSVLFCDLDQSYLSESTRTKRYTVTGSGSRYSRSDVILSSGKWGIGAEIKDRMSGTHHSYGVIDVKVFVDDKEVYHSNIDEFDWAEVDLAEVFFDDYYLSAKGKYVQRCFVEGVNNSKLIQSLPETGVIELAAGDVKNVRIVAADAAGNESVCSFRLLANGSKGEKEDQVVYPYDEASFILGEGFYLEIQNHSMYRDGAVEVNALKRDGKVYSWKFADEWFVFFKPFRLSLDGSSIPWECRDKALVMCERDGRHRRVDGKWNGLYYTMETRFPGRFYFAMDTVAPVLRGGFRDSTHLQSRSKVLYQVSDNLSGMESYNAWVDDEWVLLQYDPRYRSLKYIFDDRIERNVWHNWRIQVVDAMGNVKEDELVFYY